MFCTYEKVRKINRFESIFKVEVYDYKGYKLCPSGKFNIDINGDLIAYVMNRNNQVAKFYDVYWGGVQIDFDSESNIIRKQSTIKPSDGFYDIKFIQLGESHSINFRGDSLLSDVYGMYDFFAYDNLDYIGNFKQKTRFKAPMIKQDVEYMTILQEDHNNRLVTNNMIEKYLAQLESSERLIVYPFNIKDSNYIGYFPIRGNGVEFFYLNSYDFRDDMDAFYSDLMRSNVVINQIDVTGVPNMVLKILGLSSVTPSQMSGITEVSSRQGEDYIRNVIHCFSCAMRYKMEYEIGNIEDINPVKVVNVLSIFIFGFLSVYTPRNLLHMLKFLVNAINQNLTYFNSDADFSNFNFNLVVDGTARQALIELVNHNILLGVEFTGVGGASTFRYFPPKYRDTTFDPISITRVLGFQNYSYDDIVTAVHYRTNRCLQLLRKVANKGISNRLKDAFTNLSNQNMGLTYTKEGIARYIHSVYRYYEDIGPYPMTRPGFGIDNNLYIFGNIPGSIIDVKTNAPFSCLLLAKDVTIFRSPNCIKHMLDQAHFINCSDFLLSYLRSASINIENELNSHNYFADPTSLLVSVRIPGFVNCQDILNRYKSCISMASIKNYGYASVANNALYNLSTAYLQLFNVGFFVSNNGPFMSDQYVITRTRDRMETNSAPLDLRYLEGLKDEVDISVPSHIPVLYNYIHSGYNDVTILNPAKLINMLMTGFSPPLELPISEKKDLLRRNPKFSFIGTLWTTVGRSFLNFDKLKDFAVITELVSNYWDDFLLPDIKLPL